MERKIIAILEYSNVKKAVKIQEMKVESLETEYRNLVKIQNSFEFRSSERALLTKKVNGIQLGIHSAQAKLNRLLDELESLACECDIIDDYMADFTGAKIDYDDLDELDRVLGF